MKKNKYIYRIAEANHGHEADRFYAHSDRDALRKSEELRVTIWADVILVGEVREDLNGEYEFIYPREQVVNL